MTKWQYFVTTPAQPVQTKDLDEYGQDGWVLTAAVPVQGGSVTLFFKRPISEPGDQRMFPRAAPGGGMKLV